MGKSFRADSDYDHTHRDRRNIEHARLLREAKKHKREVVADIPPDERDVEEDTEWK